MTWLDLNFAIVGVAYEQINTQKDPHEPILIKPIDIMEYGGKLESKAGVAVLNEFGPKDVVDYLDNKSDLFQQTPDCDNGLYPIYRLRTENFRETNSRKILIRLTEILDPRLNHPMKILELSGILKLLGERTSNT